MNKMKVAVSIAFTVISLSTGIMTISAANVGGGSWNSGVGLGGSYSNYQHLSNRHSTTVVNGKNTDDFDKSTKGPGTWAKARIFVFSGCNFYWNNAA